MKKSTIIAQGIVQGVGYRSFVRQIARVMGIKGLIRNLDDGKSVEIYCEASDETSYKHFLKEIEKKGDPSDYFRIHVDSLREFIEGTPGFKGNWRTFKGFEIDYTDESLEPRDIVENLGMGLQRVYEVKESVNYLTNSTQQSFNDLGKKYGRISEIAGSMDKKLEKLDELHGIDQKISELVKASKESNKVKTTKKQKQS